MKNKYGWKRDKKDTRDIRFQIYRDIVLPRSVDLRDSIRIPIQNQQTLGSCTANAIGEADYYNQVKQNHNELFFPSRLFIYWNERFMEGNISEDSGSQIRDGIKSINTWGVCSEKLWPYDIEQFTTKPTEECYAQALDNQSVTYRSVEQNLFQLKAALTEGFPIVFGFMVYPSFESKKVAQTGTAPYPSFWERLRGPLGGHAVLCVGYNDVGNVFYCQNSWGEDWGANGYFTLPYRYLTNPQLASDFWIISKVEV